jgi:cobalt-zinc-cadmium efflux system outer membrane protein
MGIFTSLRRYGLRAAQLWLCWLPLNAMAEPLPPLTLAEASRLTLQHNPELQVGQWRLKAVAGRGVSAALKPGYEIAIEAENMLGSDEFSGIDSAEWTLSLASVIELGGKHHSRMALADSRYAVAEAERETRALDVLSEVTQTFVAALTVQEKRRVAQDAVDLAETSLRLVSRRVERGAAPAAEQLRAQSALTQAQLRERALAAELENHKLTLATHWGAGDAEFSTLAGDLYHFVQAPDFPVLFERIANTPALQVFASESRLRDAELALARSQSAADIQWNLGVRRFEASGASALTAGISVPLGTSRRNRGDVQAALAERQRVDYDRETTLLALRAQLFAAWQTHQFSTTAARQIRSEVLPNLELALEQTHQAYEQGRYSYVDWVAAQRELLDARLALIDAASTALMNQALIEQLTAEPLTASTHQIQSQDTQ